MTDFNIEIEELENIAAELADKSLRWHFHIASARCMIAEGRDGITFVLEDISSGHRYWAPATHGNLDVGHRLAKRLHGAEVFDSSTAVQQNLTSEEASLVEKARLLSENSQPWHHHVLFPDCAFNPNPGSWTLQLEAVDSIYTTNSSSEPKAALSVIEMLFYAQPAID